MLLAGIDGEHAIGAPTNYITYFLRQMKWRTAWHEAKGFSQHYYRGYYSANSLFLKALRSRITPEVLRAFKRSVSAPMRFRHMLIGNAVLKSFAREINLPGRISEGERGRLPPALANIEEWHRHIMQLPHLVSAIERYERIGSYFKVEGRHPLLDVRLLEYSSGLPLEQKVRDGWSKIMLRRLAGTRLPGSVAWREGWEELGWKFTVEHARQTDYRHTNELKTVKNMLVQYVNTRRLKNILPATPEKEASGLAISFHHHQLNRWLLQRSR